MDFAILVPEVKTKSLFGNHLVSLDCFADCNFFDFKRFELKNVLCPKQQVSLVQMRTKAA